MRLSGLALDRDRSSALLLDCPLDLLGARLLALDEALKHERPGKASVKGGGKALGGCRV